MTKCRFDDNDATEKIKVSTVFTGVPQTTSKEVSVCAKCFKALQKG